MKAVRNKFMHKYATKNPQWVSIKV